MSQQRIRNAEIAFAGASRGRPGVMVIGGTGSVGLGRNAAGFALREAIGTLKRDGNTKALKDRMLSGKEYNEVLGIAEVQAWEKQYLMGR